MEMGKTCSQATYIPIAGHISNDKRQTEPFKKKRKERKKKKQSSNDMKEVFFFI